MRGGSPGATASWLEDADLRLEADESSAVTARERPRGSTRTVCVGNSAPLYPGGGGFSTGLVDGDVRKVQSFGSIQRWSRVLAG